MPQAIRFARAVPSTLAALPDGARSAVGATGFTRLAVTIGPVAPMLAFEGEGNFLRSPRPTDGRNRSRSRL